MTTIRDEHRRQQDGDSDKGEPEPNLPKRSAERTYHDCESKTSILSEVLVKDRRIAGIRLRPGWAPYFEELLRTIGSRERETGLEPATTYLEGRRSTS